jgi:hypothetical protein
MDGAAVPSWSCSKALYKPVWHIPLLSVQWMNSWWWTDELPETCRVSWQNKYVKLVYLFGVIIKKVPRYCCPNHHRSVSVFHSRNKALRIISFLGRSPNINPAWCWEQRDGRLIWIHYVFTFIKCPGFTITTPSFPVFSVVFINQMYSKCSCTVDAGFVKISSDYFCGSSKWILNSAVTYAAVIQWFLDTILFNIRRSIHLVLVLVHYSSKLNMYSYHLFISHNLENCCCGCS